MLAQDAMIAPLGFFQRCQIVFQILLREPCGAVEPLQLLARLIPFPIGAGDAGELERADVTGAGNMRAAAEVDELSLAVKRHRRVIFQPGVDVLDLEFLAELFGTAAALCRAALRVAQTLRRP